MKTVWKVILTIVLVAVIASVALIIWVWKNPLTLYIWVSRSNLDKAGLERVVLEHPDGDLTYWTGGSGPDLVFVHGAGDQAGAWMKVAPAFIDRYRVLIPDLPGHGDSDPLEGALPFETVVTGFERLLESRDPGEPVTLVGNSLGAWLSFIYATAHPDDVARIVAVNGGPIEGAVVKLVPENREEAAALMEMLRDPASPEIPGWVLDDIVDLAGDGPIARMSRDIAGQNHYLMDDRLHEVATPVDLVWGESDGLFKKDYVDRLLEGIPATRVTWITRCGHSPNNECPDRLVGALEQVLALDPPLSLEGGEP